jgi:Tfp pilus assembly protein PilP
MRRLLLLSILLLLAGCAAASGYDPKRYAKQDAGAPDPETAPLPPQPKTTIPDPKHP